MRRALFLLMFAGCIPTDPGPDPYPGPIGDDAPPPPPTGYCVRDADCTAAGEACADTRECAPADSLRRVSVHWTVAGLPPTDDACVKSPFLSLSLGTQTWAPVRCAAGTFTVLRVPSWDDTASVASETDGTPSTVASIPPEGGDVTVDISFP